MIVQACYGTDDEESALVSAYWQRWGYWLRLEACRLPPRLRPIAAAQTSTVQLVQAYLSALGPAGNKLSKVEAALKALGPSATRAQVLAAVAPLGPVLAPIEALLAAPPPTTLEALGEPEIRGNEDYSIGRPDGAHLDVAARFTPMASKLIRGSAALC